MAAFFYRIIIFDSIKTLREDVHSREWEDVACATALGARVSYTKLFLVE